MATYAIGDIQGCLTELRHLLDLIRFDPARDRLWLVGDLVNRGPDSAGVLRLVKSLGGSAISVLGNHDLHLLAVAADAAERHRSDTLDDILNAPDRDELLDWLRHRHILYAEREFVLLHAGLLPDWSVEQALKLANEVETELRGDNHHEFLLRMYGNHPDHWEDNLSGYKRLRVITNALTRLRVCSTNGEMQFKYKGVPQEIPPGYLPWFEVPGRASRDAVIVCGHWSALGLKVTPNLIALDTGCLWGGTLTAIRLEDRAIFQSPCTISVAKDW